MSDEQIDLLERLTAHPPGRADVPPSDGAPAEVEVTPVRLTRTDPACDMRRFYSLELAASLFGECGVVRHWLGQITQPWHRVSGDRHCPVAGPA